jgi:uncharacterized protein
LKTKPRRHKERNEHKHEAAALNAAGSYNAFSASACPGCEKRIAAMPVAMELSRIIISEINEQQVIYLKEIDGNRMFPILIGIFEATSIDRRVKGLEAPRPLTHDLLVNSVESLGAEFQDVVISELRDHIYFAKLRVRHEGELVEIDARPSDAIAVAVTCDPALPIYVSEDVLNDVMGEQS